MPGQPSGILTKYIGDAMGHISWVSVVNSRCPGNRVVEALVTHDVQKNLEAAEELTVTPLRLLRKLELCIILMKKDDHLHFASHEYVCLCVKIYVFIQALLELSEDYDAVYSSVEALSEKHNCNVVKNLLNGKIIE